MIPDNIGDPFRNKLCKWPYRTPEVSQKTSNSLAWFLLCMTSETSRFVLSARKSTIIFVLKMYRFVNRIHFPSKDCSCSLCSRHHARFRIGFLCDNSISNYAGRLVSHISFHLGKHVQSQNFPHCRPSVDTYQTRFSSEDRIDWSGQHSTNLKIHSHRYASYNFKPSSKHKLSYLEWKEPLLCKKLIAVCITCVSSTAFMKSVFSWSSFDVTFSLLDASNS